MIEIEIQIEIATWCSSSSTHIPWSFFGAPAQFPSSFHFPLLLLGRAPSAISAAGMATSQAYGTAREKSGSSLSSTLLYFTFDFPMLVYGSNMKDLKAQGSFTQQTIRSFMALSDKQRSRVKMVDMTLLHSSSVSRSASEIIVEVKPGRLLILTIDVVKSGLAVEQFFQLLTKSCSNAISSLLDPKLSITNKNLYAVSSTAYSVNHSTSQVKKHLLEAMTRSTSGLREVYNILGIDHASCQGGAEGGESETDAQGLKGARSEASLQAQCFAGGRYLWGGGGRRRWHGFL